MKNKGYKRVAALLLGCLLAVSPCLTEHMPLSGMVSMASERTASVNATNLNVRSGPGTSYPAVAKLSQGAPVTVIGEQTGTDGKLWYQIRFSGTGGTETTGFVSSDYIKFPTAVTSDGDFERYMNSQGFPESYKQGLRELHARYPQWTFTAFQTNLDWNTVIQNESVIGRNLVGRENVSSWKSTAPGAYDWDTGTWPGFDGSAWVQASEDIIRYYMDPRNFLNDKYIFQFMKQSYDSSIHTKAGLESMVAGTFLSGGTGGGSAPSGGSSSDGSSSGGSSPGGPGGSGGSGPGSGPGAQTGPGPGGSSGNNENVPGTGPISPLASVSDHQVDRVMTAYGPGMDGSSGFADPGGSADNYSGSGNSSGGTAPVSGSSSYVDIIMNAAAQSGVSPYILATMIIQEQGSQGTGRSISGTVSGYQGYYNFFNIEAYQSGSMGAVERGLWWASQSGSYERPWNSVEKSILGGAVYYGNNYVKRGQDTLYLKKFNVQGDNLYKHQYMTNVLAAAAEGLTLAKISALKTTALEFSIPVYKNMPSTACAKPTTDGSPNNKLSGLGVEGFALTPTFSRDTESYDLIVDHSVANVTVAASAIDSKAGVSGTGSINLQSGNNDITVTVKAQNGNVRNYIIHVVRQNNGPTYSDNIGSGVNPGGSGSSGGGSGSGPGGGSANGPGGSSSGSSGGSSGGPVIAPDGSSSGSNSNSGLESGNTGGPMAPGTNVSGFGTTQDSSGLAGPNINTNAPGGGSSGNSKPGSGGGSSRPGSGGGSSRPGNSSGNSRPGGNSTSNNPGSDSSGNQSGASGSPQLVNAGVTAAQLAESLTSAGAGSIVKVYTPSGAEVTGSVSTGNFVQAYGADGSPTTRHDVIVKGDNTGDGKLNILDLLKAQRHILGLETLTGLFEKAADVNGNGKIDIMDILAMQKDILGLQKLN